MLTFHVPVWLLLIPVFLGYLALTRRRADYVDEVGAQAITLVHPQLGSALAGGRAPHRARHTIWWSHVATLLLCVALAQPQSVGDWIPEAPQGRDIVLLLDTSATMSIRDFELDAQPVERLTVLKGIMHQFVEQRPEDRFGVVVFGTNASTLVPPTFDHDLVSAALNRIQAGIAGENTAIGDALGLALKQVRLQGRARPALILVTDGDNTSGEMRPAEAVELARHMSVPVYCVQIGGDAPELRSATADTEILEPGLRDIAALTHGRYYVAGNSDALSAVIHDIGALEKSIVRPATQRAVTEWYLLPLLLAAVLLTTRRMLQLRRSA
jgi:Ca-activated chloride channel family protein